MVFDKKTIKNAVILGNAVTVKGILILGGWYLGNKLDRALATAPWLMFLGIVLGMSFGLWYLLLMAKKLGEK